RVKLLCFRELASIAVKVGQTMQGLRTLADRQGVLVERLRLCKPALLLIEPGQIVKALGYSGIVIRQYAFSDHQCAHEQWFGLVELPLSLVQLGQIVEAARDAGMVLRQDALSKGEGSLQQPLSLCRTTAGASKEAEAIKDRRSGNDQGRKSQDSRNADRLDPIA